MVAVHLLQANVALEKKTARLEIAKAVAHDPHSEPARVAEAELSDDPQVLNALKHDFSNSASMLRLLGARTNDPVKRERLLRESLQLNPDDPTTNVELAATLLSRSNVTEAEPFARVAVEKRPTWQRMIRVWAAVLARTGHCPDAVAQQRLAIARLSDDADPKDREMMRASLTSYETHCRQ